MIGPHDLQWCNSYRVACRGAAVAFPRDIDDLASLAVRAVPWTLIGHGNNVILTGNAYGPDRPIIVMRRFADRIAVDGTRLRAAAGASLRRLCLAAARAGLSGLERLWDIPSSLGGAICMNAGAYGADIHALLVEVETFDMVARSTKRRTRDQLGTGYRRSALQASHEIVVAAELQLRRSDPRAIWREMGRVGARRRLAFPYGRPNAGSVFKRPADGQPAGLLIERAGLKGHRIGGAEISTQHAGFMVNGGGATGRDLLRLALLAQERVEREFGARLEMEQIAL